MICPHLCNVYFITFLANFVPDNFIKTKYSGENPAPVGTKSQLLPFDAPLRFKRNKDNISPNSYLLLDWEVESGYIFWWSRARASFLTDPLLPLLARCRSPGFALSIKVLSTLSQVWCNILHFQWVCWGALHKYSTRCVCMACFWTSAKFATHHFAKILHLTFVFFRVSFSLT